MLSFLLVLCGAAAESPVPVPPEPPRAAVFLQPVGSVVFGLLGIASASGGVQWVVSDRWSFTLDTAVVWSNGSNPTATERFPGGTSMAVSAGGSWRIAGSGLRGLFVTPKVYGNASSNDEKRDGRTLTRYNTGELGVGVDLSVQWHWQSFFIGSVLGVGAGFGVTPSTVVTFTPSRFGGVALWDGSSRDGLGPTLSVNLHLLRIGVAL